MTDHTCRVLYAKYNSTRCPEYRITTEVCEDEGGLFVQKRAGDAAAAAHLENIHKNALDLRDYYDGIRVIPSELSEGALRFPYIRGEKIGRASCRDRV